MTLPVRFWAKVNRTESGCWNWTGCLNSRGYGCLTVSGRRYLAHRVAYAGLVEPIADGLTIDHLCRNKRCVNPAHLEVVTLRENVQRAFRLITKCREGHDLISRPGDRQRRCRVCERARRRERQKAQSA